MNRRMLDRGIALILSLAVLAVLSLLTSVFVRLMSVERTSASNHALDVRAEMIADAGVARAIEELRQSAATAHVSAWGDRWIFRDNAGSDIDYAEHTPLQRCYFPSLPLDRDADGFFENGLGGTSSDDLIHGRAVSGLIYGAGGISYGRFSLDELGQVYVLRIRDTAGKLNINGRQSSMAAMLDHLGEAVEEVEFYDPIAGRGAEIVALRDAQPGGAFHTLDELVGVLTRDEVDDLRGYLTCHSWLDDRVVGYAPSSDPATLPTLSTAPRHPVNVNTAAKPVLTALFRDVAGHVRWIGTTADSMLATPPVSKSQAEGLADRLISLRKGASLRTYHQLATVIRSFQDDLALTDGQIAALLANLDPSTRLNQFNADSARAAGMSKADLTRASTELCFGASGYFEIESMGILTAGGGTTVGLGWSSVVVRIADVIRHATQSEFTSGRIGGVNTTTHPNAAIDAASSTIDGQVSMFVPPPVIPAFTHANYCISITSAVGKLPTNHIVQYIPDAHILTVMETVDNDKGWGVEYEDHEPKTGMRGFKFTPGVLGGKKKVEKVRYCFSVPDGALDVLKVITKAGSPSHIIEFPIDPPPLPGTSKYDPDGFKVTFEGYYLHTEDGSSTSHGLPDRFYATYYRGFDAVLGWHKTATTTRTKGTRALGGSSLMPDGTLSRRAIPAQLSYKATDNLHKLQGTLEFWVKLADDGGAGAFEPLIYAVNPIAETETQALITRIVRHGTSLIATRGYVGTPTAAAGPYPLSMTESIADVASWRKHEWHHVAIVWFDGTDHRFYVDGVLAAERTTATAPMLLIDNDATDRMCVGGYTYGAGIERYSTSTISELKIYSLLEYTGPSFEPSARFVADDSTTACHWSGRLHLPYTEGARVAAISWIERRPDGWATQEYDDAATPDVEVSYRLGSSLVWIDLPKADASGGDGRGVDLSLDLAPGAASTFVYRFRFTCSVEPFNAAPAIDELRIIVVGPPRYLLLRTR